MSRAQAGKFGALPGRIHEAVQVLGEKWDVLSGTILEYESKSTRGADARDRGRWEGERVGFGQAGQFSIQMTADRLVLFSGPLSFIPWFERDEEKGVVSALNLAEKTEPNHARAIPHARGLQQHLLDLFAEGVRPI